MRAKLAALAIAVFVALGASRAVDARANISASMEAASIVLLPQAVSGYKPTQHWHHPPFGSTIEEGALYSALNGNSTTVQLDFYRNTRLPHNGAYCYLVQGETLQSESLRTVKLLTGNAIFDVVILRANNHLRLAAATECSAQGCAETRPLTIDTLWLTWRLKSFTPTANPAVVPFSIVIDHTDATGQDASAITEAQLLDEFLHTAAMLDLEPAQKLAAALNSTGG